MARIRTIKPEFFNSYDIASISPLSRLFYAYLWTESDREGLLEWKPKNFRMRFFPTDQYDISDLENELIEAGLIVLHDDICEIPAFTKHQVINNRESESDLLPHVKDACKRVKAEGRKEGKGREGASKNASQQNKTSIPENWQPSELSKTWFAKQSFSFSFADMVEEFIAGCKAKNYKYADFDSAFKNWSKKRQERLGPKEKFSDYMAGGI